MDELNKVLIVDDNPNNLRVLGEILEQAGFDVRPALSGEIALLAVEAEPPDLILLDIRMPGLNGYETCRRIKEKPKSRDIPIIFVSANEDIEDKLSAFDAGGVDYVVKPFQEREVLVRVRTHIRLRNLEALHHEVAERLRAEQSLRENEAKQNAILANSIDVISIIDSSGVCLFLSSNITKWFGWDSEDLVGSSFSQNVHPDDLKSIQKIFSLISTEAERSEFLECRYLCKDGQYKWIEFQLVNRLSVPEINGLLGSFHDVTAKKQIELENARLGGLLQQAQKMEFVGRLAGGVAHDFNNMLGVILGHVEMALTHTAPELSTHANLMEILNAANRSAELTRQLLAFARQQPASVQVVDINKSTEKMIKMLEHLIGKDIQLYWKPANDLWMVALDPSQMDQILTNLCVNARDAISGSGEISISTGNRCFDTAFCTKNPSHQAGEFVMLSVSDNGCGMDEETMAKIFEPFFTTKDIGKGTGLGLSTVFGIVKQNKGFIILESQLTQGTTFSIYLPRNESKFVASVPESQLPDLRPGKETILVAEDGVDILKIICLVLELQGYAVLAANSSEEAVKLAQLHNGKIDLLLTDVMMPKMNGRELAAKLGSGYGNLKCLFMSGYPNDNLMGKSGTGEKVNFIQKPFTSRELLLAVRKVLDG